MNFSHEELEQMQLVEGALAMTALTDPAFPKGWVQIQLERMAKEAEHALMDEPNPHVRLDGLIRLFYREWGFEGDEQQYFSSDNIYLDKVLDRKRGIPVSLGAIFLYLANHLDLPVSSVGFPTQFILKVTWYQGEVQYINPFDGEFLSMRTLRGWLKGAKGPFAQIGDADLANATNSDIIKRWLTVMKSALLREEQYTDALRCSDLALKMQPDDPHEIRDRGYIYQKLDCSHAAASDYSYFIEQCPEDPAAELLKLQVAALNEEPLTLH